MAVCAECTGRPCRKVEAYFKPLIQGDEVVWDNRCEYYEEPRKEREPETSVVSIGAILDSSILKNMINQRHATMKPQYAARYGVKLTDEQYSALDKVLFHLPECDDCRGICCNKTVGKYLRPKVSVTENGIEAEMELCDVWRNVAYKKQCFNVGIPGKYTGKTFADYKVTADNKQAVDMAKWFVREPRDKGLYFFGGTGTGKTYLASLTAQELVRQRRDIIFGDVPELLKRLKETFDKGGTEQVLNRYVKTPVLVLDDFGAGQITEWTVGVLYQIINERYNANRPVIVTSNYDLNGLGERLTLKNDDFSAERIVSRLKEMCYQAFLGTKDRR